MQRQDDHSATCNMDTSSLELISSLMKIYNFFLDKIKEVNVISINHSMGHNLM